MTLAYRHEDRIIAYDRPLTPDLTLTISAGDIHRETTGVHARLRLSVKGVSLAWSTINIEKDDQRGRLARSAHRYLAGRNGQAEVIDLDRLIKDVGDFCEGLWREHLTETQPELLEGDLEPRPLDFLIEPYILRGGGTICYAPPGRGKSYMLLLMAVSLDCGQTTPLWPIRQTPVLVINLERSRHSYRQRLGAINRALGLPANRPLRIINARGRRLADVYDSAFETVRSNHIGCVFLDSISRAGYGDLNENQPVNAIADALNNLCESWFALAHTPRSDESHVFGSVHFEAAADVMLQLSSEQDEADKPLGVGLQVTKQNDFARQRDVGIYKLDFSSNGLAAVSRAAAGEFAGLEQQRSQSLRERIKAYILDTDRSMASTRQIASALQLDRSRISHVLNGDKAFVKLPRQPGRKEIFYGIHADDR